MYCPRSTKEEDQMMRILVQCLVVGTATLVMAGRGLAAGPYVYPQKGQSADQQSKDSYECANWAKGQSGVDPAAPAAPSHPRQNARGPLGGAEGRGGVGGGAGGAGVGAAVGAIAGDAGKGAAAGAVVGGVGGRRRAVAAKQAQQQETRSSYDRAFAACMDGRGYSVR